MSYNDTMTTRAAFSRYEAIRHRMPSAQFPDTSTNCSGLLELANKYDAFVLDSFGVLNVGDRAIPGAPECLEALRQQGKLLIVLTNAASYTHAKALERYHRLGFDFAPHEVVSSRDVAVARLDLVAPTIRWGAIAAREDQFQDMNGGIIHWDGTEDVDGFLLLSSSAFDDEALASLASALRGRNRPVVVANPDLVAPRETGLSKEPGYFAHELADALGIDPIFFGKPYPAAFEDALSRLPGVARSRIAMVGDTLHTNILGGQSCGLDTVLVENYGLFAGEDVEKYISDSGIVPTYRCQGIA
ncbi:MAG: TIGR01459 family HAD-type hydrolase [Pseudomonadota bacterium]